MIEVVRPGALTTVQDRGRIGWAHLGIPRSGALDQPALRRANQLVGNDAGAAGLETTLTGCVLRFRAHTTVAVTGAAARVSVDDQVRPHNEAFAVRAGAVLTIGTARAGVRSYLGVRGGIDAVPVLGSRATDTLSGLGPAPISAGDVLPIGTTVGTEIGTGADTVLGTGVGETLESESAALRIRRGPRDDWFTDGAWASLCGGPYTVSVRSNRVGARLDGAALARRTASELPSEGIVLGAVQVTADGQPLVFLADHPTTGGYPVIGVVDIADVPLLAQARPGTTVRFYGPQC